MNQTAAAAFLAAATLSGCIGQPPGADPVELGILPFAPVSQERMRTTDGAIFLGNLDAIIGSLTQRLEQRPSATLEGLLAAQLFSRYRILARLYDLERSAALVRNSMSALPTPSTALLQARIDAAFHRFDAALATLDQLDADSTDMGESVHGLRMDILRAMGRIDGWTPGARTRPSTQSLTREAIALLDQGRLGDAMVRFHLAERAYRNTHPYPLAFLHSQIGIGYLRYGRLQDARLFLESALSRLPGFVGAKDHLAETLLRLGDSKAAIILFRELAESTGDPEFCGVLEGLFDKLDPGQEQNHYRQCARLGFEQRLSAHPLAYQQHAAEYYLDRGETARALELATANARMRSDVPSMILLAGAARATGEIASVCRVAASLVARNLDPPELARFDVSRCETDK